MNAQWESSDPQSTSSTGTLWISSDWPLINWLPCIILNRDKTKKKSPNKKIPSKWCNRLSMSIKRKFNRSSVFLEENSTYHSIQKRRKCKEIMPTTNNLTDLLILKAVNWEPKEEVKTIKIIWMNPNHHQLLSKTSTLKPNQNLKFKRMNLITTTNAFPQ